MPELPELQALVEGLAGAIVGRTVEGVAEWSPGTLRTAEPPLAEMVGRRVDGVWRRGKLIAVRMGAHTLVLHLMSAGRLGLSPAAEKRPGRSAGLALRLDGGQELRLRELSTERRASAHLLDDAGLAAHHPLARLGPEPSGLDADGWAAALSSPLAALHTALRDGRRVAGIGRCYASEIMWAARLAPFARSDRLTDDDRNRLARGADVVLDGALARARERITTRLPDKEKRITAVHGHYGDPCLRCGRSLERVSFAGYELVYCPVCQTGGRVYADRRRSRLGLPPRAPAG